MTMLNQLFYFLLNRFFFRQFIPLLNQFLSHFVGFHGFLIEIFSQFFDSLIHFVFQLQLVIHFFVLPRHRLIRRHPYQDRLRPYPRHHHLDLLPMKSHLSCPLLVYHSTMLYCHFCLTSLSFDHFTLGLFILFLLNSIILLIPSLFEQISLCIPLFSPYICPHILTAFKQLLGSEDRSG